MLGIYNEGIRMYVDDTQAKGVKSGFAIGGLTNQGKGETEYFRITSDSARITFNQPAKGYHKNFSLSNAVLGLLIDKSKYMDAPEGKWKPFKDNYVNGPSYGGLIGTANAFAKYLQELLKPRSKLISDDYKKVMFTENVTTDNIPTGMCLWTGGPTARG